MIGLISFPASLLLVPGVVVLGALYVLAGRLTNGIARRVTRVGLLAVAWLSPLLTTGPGPAQLTLGLVVGFLGIRMTALGERWRGARARPSFATALAKMATPEELIVLSSGPRARAWANLVLGVVAGAAAVALLLIGNRFRLWQWSRLADDLLVFVEVGIGASGIHGVVVGASALAGRSVVGLQDSPLLSSSLSQFWARRWNHLVQGNLDRGFFRPLGRRRAIAGGTVLAFTASGIMHVIAVLDAGPLAITWGPSVAVMGFFLIHAGLVLAERARGRHRAPQGRGALLRARVQTIILFALLSPLLLDPFACVAHVHGRTL